MRYASSSLARPGPAPAAREFEQPPGMIAAAGPDWRQVATPSDRDRLRDWRSAFVDALRRRGQAGHAADIAREGALLEPDAALGGGPIPERHCIAAG